ncbi:MAG: PKD domain-containing protein [Thermoplasmata archaeon]
MKPPISDISKEELYMKSGKLNKMATTLAVLFLVISGLMVVQWNAQPAEASEHEDYTSTIEGFLDTDDVVIESNLEIKLKSLSTGEVRNEHTSEYFYEFTEVEPGWYEIIVPSQVKDGVAYMRNTTEPFEVPDQGEGIPNKINIGATEDTDTLEGQVTDVEENSIEDATVTLKTEDFEHSVNTETKTENNETISHYSIEVYNGFDGTLMIEKDGYAPDINTNFTFQDQGYYNVTLTKRPMIEGNLVDQSGSGIREEMDITVYNESTGILHTTKSGPTFRIRAAKNYTYTLVVSAPGYEPLVRQSEGPLGENERRFIGTHSVSESKPEEFQTGIDFNSGEDLNEMEVTTSRQLRNNTRIETLDNDYLGHLSMQIDHALGENNIEEFKRRLDYTKDIQYTPNFIMVNDTVYELEDYDSKFSDGLEANLTRDATDLFEGTLYFNTTRTYTAVDDIDEARHIIDLEVENNRTYGNFRDKSYTVDLTDDYERYMGPGTEEVIPENVDVNGYTELDISPGENDLTSDLKLDIRQSEEGEVNLGINNSSEPTIEEIEEGGEYVVKDGTEVVFEAEHQNDVSQAIHYDWDLPVEYDGDEDPWMRTITFEKGDSGDHTVSVNVTESSGNYVEDEIDITVDVDGPDGPILVDDKEYSDDDTLNVNESEEIDFSGSQITDDATDSVALYRWNFTDGSQIQEGMNITHEFETPGEYDVTLNVTDAVENTNEIKLHFEVADTTKPVGNFTIEWDDQVSQESLVNIVKGTNVTFNATDIEAHPDYEGEIEGYNWTLRDEDDEVIEENEEVIWTYSDFTESGEYTIRLNVTDQSGNFKEETKTLVIERGPVPDLLASDLRFSADNPRVGDTVTISVNVSNVGDVNATNIDSSLTINNDSLVEFDQTFYKDGEELNRTMIKPGETVTIEIGWEPEEDGDNDVAVNITDAEEPDDLRFDNEMEETIDVRQAVWREYLVYALIPIIIIGVAVGLYMFKDRLR